MILIGTELTGLPMLNNLHKYNSFLRNKSNIFSVFITNAFEKYHLNQNK